MSLYPDKEDNIPKNFYEKLIELLTDLDEEL